MRDYFHESTGDYRISLTDMLSEFFPHHGVLDRARRAALKGRAYKLGAAYLGKARMLGGKRNGVFSIAPEDWEAFCRRMAAPIDVAELRSGDDLYYRPTTNDYRMTAPQLCAVFGLPLTLKDRNMVKDCAERIGTRRLAQARVNLPGGEEAARNKVYIIDRDDWAMWKNKMKKLLDLLVQPD